MRIVLELYGPIASKKNRYRAVIGKSGNKKGKAQIVRDRKLNAKLEYLVQQVPRDAWDLRLLHPTITMQRFCPAESFNQDRDNILVALMDEVLVRTGIIHDDSDLYNNGDWHILKTQIADIHKVVLILETEE